MDEIEMERKLINDDSPEARFHKEVHSLCMRRLKEGVAADQVAVALLYNAFCGLMNRYGIPEARKMLEECVCWYFDRAERDPDYEHLRTRGRREGEPDLAYERFWKRHRRDDRDDQNLAPRADATEGQW
jgi:hypothetical protein